MSVTNKCNLKCRTCNIWQTYIHTPHLAEQEMSLEDYELFFKNFKFWNWISITGGEPFIREDLTDIIQVAYNSCKGLHTISIVTNGYLTDKIVDDVKKMLVIGVPSLYVSISLDGLKELHDMNRGVDGSFERAISTYESLNELRNRRLKIHFEYLISKYNQGKLAETLTTLKIDPNNIILTIAQRSSFYYNMSLNIEPNRDVLIQDIKWFMSRLKTLSIHDIAQKVFLKHVCNLTPIPCIAGRNSFYLDP